MIILTEICYGQKTNGKDRVFVPCPNKDAQEGFLHWFGQGYCLDCRDLNDWREQNGIKNIMSCRKYPPNYTWRPYKKPDMSNLRQQLESRITLLKELNVR